MREKKKKNETIRFNEVLFREQRPVSYNTLGYLKEGNLTQNIR